jgi:hypothetical protein
MIKILRKAEKPYGHLMITQSATISGIARMGFFIISDNGNVPASARPGTQV